MFLSLLRNDGHFLVRDLCPKKPLELSYDDLKQSLSLLSDYIKPKTEFNNRTVKI